MPIGIYPPILLSTLTAFLASTSEYPIYFTLLLITSYSDIGHVQIRIVRQSNNRSIVDTSLYPDGVIYCNASDIKISGNTYYVNILKEYLSDSWTAGYLYKVQMRFGSTAKYTDKNSFADWKKTQINNLTFSEWSNVMVIKAISKPSVYIENADSIKEDVISTEHTESTLTPLFVGGYSIDSASNESLDKYKFTLYLGLELDTAEELETSGWLQHNGSVNTSDKYRFKTILENNNYYIVTYEIETINGYTDSAAAYNFQAVKTYLEELEGFILTIDDQDNYCSDNGCINIYLTTSEAVSGCYVITRSSEISNYGLWEDLAYLVYANESFDNTLIYQDFTIESGIKYKYAILLLNAAELRSSPLYETNNPYKMVDFEYSYLYRDGILLRLMFNQKLSSFKHTVLASKQDTLGDKYPHLTKNGYAYYAEFPVSGLISFLMDEDLTFFVLKTDGFYYNDELIIPKDKYVENRNERDEDVSWGTVNSNLTDNNVFIERKFREKVEEFLNDFNYKLYKSPTEGNIIVGLMNVSLTPNSTLSRMIFDFSATAYEVVENTLDNLNDTGIITIGEYDTINSTEIYKSFGQIKGVYSEVETTRDNSGNIVNYTVTSEAINVYDLIKEQEEISLTGGYKMLLENLSAVWIEYYPQDDFTAEITELEAKLSELKEAGEDTSAVLAEINAYENLALALLRPVTSAVLSINGNNIIMLPNKVYSLHETVRTLNVVSAVYPIIINYVCGLTQLEDTSIGVISSIDSSRIWGLVSGIFTGTDSVLKHYNYNYGPNELPYRVYSNSSESDCITDGYRIIVDNTTYNVYKTVNLYNIIEEDTRKQVEYIYNIFGGFTLDENGDWTDGTTYYLFLDIILFDIEADPNTVLLISQNADGSNAVEVMLGATGRYTLNPAEGLIKYLALKEALYAIINYKCLTTQMKKKKGI